jgi:outer membrane protein assembly factor BamA
VASPYDQEKFDKQLSSVYSKYFDEGFIYIEIQPDYQKQGRFLNVVLKVTENTRAPNP